MLHENSLWAQKTTGWSRRKRQLLEKCRGSPGVPLPWGDIRWGFVSCRFWRPIEWSYIYLLAFPFFGGTSLNMLLGDRMQSGWLSLTATLCCLSLWEVTVVFVRATCATWPVRAISCDCCEEWTCWSGMKSSAGMGMEGECATWANPTKAGQIWLGRHLPALYDWSTHNTVPRYIQSTFGLGGSQSSSSFCTAWWDIKFIKRGRGTCWHPLSLPASFSTAVMLSCRTWAASHTCCLLHFPCVHHADCHLYAWNARIFAFSTICLTSKCPEVVPWAHTQHCSHATSAGHSKDHAAETSGRLGVFSVAPAHLFKQGTKQGD